MSWWLANGWLVNAGLANACIPPKGTNYFERSAEKAKRTMGWRDDRQMLQKMIVYSRRNGTGFLTQDWQLR
ncbi:MAG: hypothetical protein DA446_09200 [Bacteroidetes bacterium]|nr:MAG: hypothetical protein DA446_09200 [Bacteroidota bacterium]